MDRHLGARREGGAAAESREGPARFLEARREVVATAQRLTNKGFLMATGGNVSVRIPGEMAFAVTPSNFDYLKMEPEHVCVLDFDRNVLAGELPPSVEAPIHAAIYAHRADVNAVVHTHQVHASALAILGEPIPALFDEQARFLGRRVAVLPYAPSGTGLLRAVVVWGSRSHANAYIMKNHGALCLGHTIERAAHNVEILEKCAEAYLLALRTGRRVHTLPWLVREAAFAKLRADQKLAASGVISNRGE